MTAQRTTSSVTAGHTWGDLAAAAGVSPEEAHYMLWNASAFPFDYPRAIYEQLRHAVRHKVCIDLLPSRYEAQLEDRYADSLYGPAHDPENYWRGAPTNCYPRTKYDRHGRRIR
jgi:hypothetical protein